MGLPDDLNHDPTPHTTGVSYPSAQDVQAVAVLAAEESPLSVPLLSDDNNETNDLVEVISPAALPEGYTFDIIASHQPFTIAVPTGGVEEGQIFSLSLPSNNDSSAASVNIPRRAWRDGLCSFCTHGWCHPSLCNALFCPLVLLGQVMTRLRLDWLGNPMRQGTISKTFQMCLVLTVVDFVVSVGLSRLPDGIVFHAVWQTYHIIWGIFIICIVTKIRGHVRDAYDIPIYSSCRGCEEDCCCAVWCSCCVVAQLARHTADYDTYNSQFCTATGLSNRAPSIV